MLINFPKTICLKQVIILIYNKIYTYNGLVITSGLTLTGVPNNWHANVWSVTPWRVTLWRAVWWRASQPITDVPLAGYVYVTCQLSYYLTVSNSVKLIPVIVSYWRITWFTILFCRPSWHVTPWHAKRSTYTYCRSYSITLFLLEGKLALFGPLLYSGNYLLLYIH